MTKGVCAIICRTGVSADLHQYPSVWRRVAVNLNNVTKCAVLDEYGLLIVLADKVSAFPSRPIKLILNEYHQSLYVYRIEDLCPSDSIPEPFRSTHTGHKLSGAKEVHYFGVGELSGMTHVIYMKKVVVRPIQPWPVTNLNLIEKQYIVGQPFSDSRTYHTKDQQ